MATSGSFSISDVCGFRQCVLTFVYGFREAAGHVGCTFVRHGLGLFTVLVPYLPGYCGYNGDDNGHAYDLPGRSPVGPYFGEFRFHSPYVSRVRFVWWYSFHGAFSFGTLGVVLSLLRRLPFSDPS